MTDAQPDAAPAPPRRGAAPLRRPRVLLIAAAVLVVVAVIGAVAWALRPTPAPSGPATIQAATAQQAVRGFLDALARSDAEGALQYALARPADVRLLTADVLKAAQAEAPLVVEEVPVVEGSGTVPVPARVTIGGEPHTITFPVRSTDTGWRLEQVTSVIDPGALPAALGPTLNGTELTDVAHLEVFPGAYVFAESSRQVSFANDRVIVGAVGEDIRAGLQPTLTATGVRTANSTAAAALRRCLAKRDVAPQGCPNSVTVAAGQKVNAKSIRWRLVGKPWRDATYTLDAADPTQARGATELTFRFRCTLTQGGETYTVDQTNSTDVRYMLTVTDAKAPVAWQRVT